MAWLEYLLPLIFLFPLAAMGVIVLALRYLQDGSVHSPFNAQPLHEPGQALRNQLYHAFSRLFLNGALGPIVTLAPLVYGMGRMLFASRQSWLEWALYGSLSTLLVLFYCFLLIRDFQHIQRIKLGFACAIAVGQELQRLVRPDAHPYFVFHDVPGANGIIDHVVITPHGVFVVETRARTRPLTLNEREINLVTVEPGRLRFPGWSEHTPLVKTLQAARWLAAELEQRCHQPVPVMGVLALPGWSIADAGMPEGIMVVSGESLAQQLDDQHLGDLDDELHRRVINALTTLAAEQAPARHSHSL